MPILLNRRREMRKILMVAIICLLTATGVWAGFFSGGGGGGATDEVGTVTDGKWCVGDSSGLIQCTSDAPAGAGDVTDVGDCIANACLDGSSDGGTYIRLYDGDSNYTAIVSSNVAANKTITLPPDTATLATLGLAETFSGAKSFTANPLIYDGNSHYLTIDVADLSGAATIVLGSDTNNLTIANGNATIDIAASATLNLDTSLTVDTAAVTLKGKSGGSTLTLPTAISLDGTLTNGKACTYASSGTVISCNTDYQPLDATLTAFKDLTIADVSIVEGTGTDAFAVVTSGGGSRVLASKSDNSALEFAAITNAHITANTIRVNELATTMTIGSTSVWDFSAITHSNTAVKGLLIPSCGTASNPTSGANYICWDTSTASLKIYDSGWKAFAATAAPAASSYVVMTAGDQATLTGSRVLTAGTAIDFTDGGAGSTITVDVDTTEVGTTTWGSGSAIVWTFNASGGTDPTITFGNNLTTLASGLTLSTGKNFIIGTTTWNSGDSIDGTKVANADLGDIGVSSGVWSVEDDSHAHTSTTITLASTNLSDTTNLVRLDAANTFTNASNVFGDAATDAVTMRARLQGYTSTALKVGSSAPTCTNTGTSQDALCVKGNMEADGSVYAASFIGGAGTDGQRGLTLTSNTALTPTADQIYFINDVLYFSQAGTQKTPMRLEDAQTVSGLKTFSGGAYFGDASTNSGVRFYDGSSNYWTMIAPTGMSTNPTFKLPSAQGSSGTYLYDSDGAGTLAWGTPTATAHGSDTYVQFNDGGTALGSDAGFTFAKSTSTLTLGKNTSGGEIILYNELGGTDYNVTIQPNAAQAAAAVITLPSYTTTLLGAGANTFTGLQAITAVNAAGGSADVLTLSGTLGAFDGSDTFRGIYLNYTNANHTSTGNTVALIDVPAITGDANSNFYGIRFGNFTGTTGAASEVEYAISIGTGFDRGVSTASPVYVGDGTNGTTIGATGGQSFAGTATFTAAGATSSVPWVVGTATANNTAEGTAYWESDTDTLTIGDGATGVGLKFTANTLITLPAATGTVMLTTGTPAAMVIASQATGDLLYASSSSAWSRLGIQAAGYVLAGGTTPGWSNAPQITTIELGAATDTTISRTGAGVIAVEGLNLPRIVAKGAVTSDFGSIAINACSTAIDGGTATGVATTDVISWNFNGDVAAVTGFVPLVAGGLYIVAYPTSDHVNFKMCNNTGAAIDPGSVTLNWMVLR
jgi:hypothetical protein